jgi:hypothetical protein
VTVNGAEKIKIYDVADSGGGIFDVTPDKGNIFQIAAGANASIKMTSINVSNYGQSGTIILLNGPSGTTWSQLPANMLTPSGADINFVTGPNLVSVISFIITKTGQVLCNYVGHFA